MPVIFPLGIDNLGGCCIDRNISNCIEFGFITHYPQQLTATTRAYPVAGNGGVFGGGFTQQFFHCPQAFFGDDGLPGAAADAVGESVQYAAGAV